MKKRLTMAILVALSMAVAGTAAAAPTSFNDVPAKHWAYDAVTKLAKAGVIDGYSDGTFRGDKPLNRYEFAIMVAKAIDHYEQTDQANKALIDKLSAEFASELNTLGARVKKVENKVGTFKLNGDMRFRYEYVKKPDEAMNWPGGVAARSTGKVATKDRYRLMISNEVAPNVSAFSLVTFSGTGTGRLSTAAYDKNNQDGGFSANPSMTGNVEAAFITYKAPDGTVYKFGRNFLYLGQGMLWDVPHADGLQVTFGNKLRTMVGTQSFIGRSWYFADMKYDLNKDIQLTAAHLADTDKMWYNSTAVGFIYKGVPNWKFSAEIGQNDNAKVNVNHGRDGKVNAGIITAKYGEAVSDKVGSIGVWVSYKKAEKGFDTQFGSTWTFVSNYPGGLADDLKGFEYGVEYIAFKNGTLQVMYNPLKSYDGSQDREFLVSQLLVRF